MAKKKRNLFLCIASLIILLISGYIANKFIREDANNQTYSSYVSNFSTVTIDQLEDKIDKKQEFVLYVGREGCPYCQIFVPKLYDAMVKTDKTVFYWDVENVDSESEEISTFLEKYNIQYTPTLVQFYEKGGFESFDFDSEKITSKEIANYLI